jgi:chromate transporter
VLFAQTGPRRYGLMLLDVPRWETFDGAAVVLCAASLVAMLRFRIDMAWTRFGSALVGMLWGLARG